MAAALIVVGAVAVLAALVVLAVRAAAKRRARLMGWATAHGWSYARSDSSYVDPVPGYPFGEGQMRSAHNVLTGSVSGFPAAMYDYSYQTSSTDSEGHQETTYHHFAVVLVRLPVPLPDLSVSPENFLTRIGSRLGLRDIELESEEFNRAFRVKCDDRKFAYDVLHARSMQALLAAPDRVPWRVAGGTLVAYDNRRMDPDTCLRWLTGLAGVVTAIPSFVWSDRGLASPPGGPA